MNAGYRINSDPHCVAGMREIPGAVATFEYEPAFAESGIEVSPLMMPLSTGALSFPALPKNTFHGLPGLLADSLPDRFGNALIDAWLATQGVELADLQDVHVDEFIRRPYRARSDCQDTPRRHEPPAVRQLLVYLRGQGLCAAAPIFVIPADVAVDNFAHSGLNRGKRSG